MAFEAGDTGRLVRLADVLRWLQSSRGLPRSEALKLLCDGLNAEVIGWLYWVQPMIWAVQVPPMYAFGYETAEQIAARKKRDHPPQFWELQVRERQNNRDGSRTTVINQPISTIYPEPTEPGLPALLKCLNAYWRLLEWNRNAGCDMLDEPRSILTTLAIPLDKAHEFWGYGTVVIAPQSAETQPASAEWTGERLAAQRAVFVAAGKRDFTKRLAKLSGLEEREIRRLIEEFNASKTDVKPHTVWPGQTIKKR